MKILIVEDDFVSRKVLERYLTKYGECRIAQDGVSGLELFRHALEHDEPYSAVFMDILMPGMDGQETVKHIREMEGKNGVGPMDGVKVIMASALDDSHNVREAFFRNHVSAYIVKPFTMSKIEEALRNSELI